MLKKVETERVFERLRDFQGYMNSTVYYPIDGEEVTLYKVQIG